MNIFDRIIHFSIYNKLIIGFLTLALIIWGVYSAANLPIDAQPDITNNQVQINTLAPTFGAQEVEQYITAPIELAMANIPRSTQSRSISRSGLSQVTVVFDDKADIYWARQQVAERLKEAEAEIPHDAGTPVMSPISTGLGEIYQYIIKPKPGYEKKYTATDLRTIQDWIVTRENLYVPLPNSGKVPLSEVATVTLKNAPTQVSRENGKRRIFVGFNIRGRDVESVVKEIQPLLAQKLKISDRLLHYLWRSV